MRVLVADDDPTYRGLLEHLLTSWGLDVTTTADGTAAMEAIRQDVPQLALLDWDMPGLDGFEITRCIRANSLTDHIYVMLVTGSRRKDEIEQVLVCGADDYLIKPFDPLDLKIHLRNAMRIIHLEEEKQASSSSRSKA